MSDANLHPSVVIIRDRLRDIFPDIKVPLEIIGWHVRQSTPIDTICANFVTEILSSGQVLDPRNQTTKDETLQSLYDVFHSIPHDHIDRIYHEFKDSSNPNWYDNIVNELLSYDVLRTSNTTEKHQLDEQNHSDEYERLIAILPDIDPDYAMECYLKFVENSSEPIDLTMLITSLIERGYEKITDKLERSRRERCKENIREPKFNIEEFLKTFSSPSEYFYDRTKNVSDAYKTHARIYLSNAFARISRTYINEVLERNNYRFAPSLKQLQEEFSNYHRRQSRDETSQRVHRRARAQLPIPDIPDEIFYKELSYTKHEDEITEYLSQKQAFRDEQIRLARANRTLQTCVCCCDEELLDDDMIHCDQHHDFCQTCVKNYIETSFLSTGQCLFSCLDPNCKCEYSTTLIGQLLAPTVFSRLLNIIQQEELRRANIPNFEQCKFCTFGTIIDDPNVRLFRCLNPDCLKETCRVCGELNHIPLRCDEVERKDELDMRTFIENRVTEAMIRVCYRCKQRFYKLEGCNKMTCACGASMCYVCREPIEGYEHFTDNTKCNAHDDVVKLHQEEMRIAYEDAKRAYIEKHPDARDVVLKYDPQKHLEPDRSLYTPKAKRRRHRH